MSYVTEGEFSIEIWGTKHPVGTFYQNGGFFNDVCLTANDVGIAKVSIANDITFAKQKIFISQQTLQTKMS